MVKLLIIRSALVILFLGGCFSVSVKKGSSELQNLLNSLATEELSVLDTFFRTLFVESQGGYVLYGNKPICIDGFPIREEGTVFLAKRIHVFSTKLKEGALLWKKLGLNQYCKNYALFVYDKPVFDKWVDLIVINKSAFYRTVEENLPLFQYALGPKVSPGELLLKLTDSNETFHSVLHDDRVLIGILLGYGTQNALFGSRTENINDCATMPSFGFSSLNEEICWLEKGGALSVDFSEEKEPLLPWFGCYENQETKVLIEGYKQAQKRISKVLKSEHFLETVLSKIFEQKITFKHQPFIQNKNLFSDRNELTKIVAHSIWRCIDQNHRDPEYILAFYDGLNACQNGALPLPENDYGELICRFYHSSPTDAEFSAMRKAVAYSAGLRVWNHFKLGKDLYSFCDVMKFLKDIQADAMSVPLIDAQTDEILTHLHSVLYDRENHS